MGCRSRARSVLDCHCVLALWQHAPLEPAQWHKRHACHAKWRSMSPSATPATQSEGRCHQVPRPQRRMHVHVAKCHACHAKWRSMSPSATPATQTGAASMAPSKRYTKASPVRQVPRLPRRMHVHVAKCHACHAKSRSMSRSATPATQTGAASTAPTGTQARHQSQPSPISTTPATQNARPCRQVPRLPRKVKVDVTKCQ